MMRSHLHAFLAGCRPHNLLALALVILVSGVPLWADPAPPARPDKIRFNRDIRPVLSEACFRCHGPDPAVRKAGLRLDTEEGLFKGNDNGPPVVKGKPEQSELYRRISSTDKNEVMPPTSAHRQLKPEEKELLRRWIAEGAHYEPHWSFARLSRPALPEVKNQTWVRNPIDVFVLAKLEEQGLRPAPEADRYTLIRRISLDLTGLPPTPKEIQDFVNDKSPDAYEKLVDRLLASPHWGEHRARYWLDAARYADTHGLHIDNYREIWPYRDWVINAFNRNLPFDQFTIEQLAGDLLPNPTLEQRIATGFNRCNITTNEGGVIPEEVEAMYMVDRVETTATVWLGLTAGCANCHNHKFDPLLQKEFYQLVAFFKNTTQKPLDGNIPDTPPVLVVPRPEDRPRWTVLQKEATQLQAEQQKRREQAGAALGKWLGSEPARALRDPVDPHSLGLHLAPAGVKGMEVTATVAGQPLELKPGAGVQIKPGVVEGQAVFFDGKGILEIDKGADLEADQPFTLATWIFVPTAETGFLVASKSDSQAKGGLHSWALEVNSRIPMLTLVGDNAGDKIQVRGNGSQRLKPGAWNHLVITYDGSRRVDGFQLYLNGKVQIAQRSNETTIKGRLTNKAPLRLGGDGKRGFVGGGLQDFRLYRRVLGAEEVALLSRWKEISSALAKEPGALAPAERGELLTLYLNRIDEGYRTAAVKLAAIEKEQSLIRQRGAITHVLQERADSVPSARVLFRGQYNQPRETVYPDVPGVLPRMPANAPKNRLGLALWLVHPDNPLPARVTVNRFWQEVFGVGLVRTAEDFGIMGESPSHPELLDWLAVEFMNPSTGVSVKTEKSSSPLSPPAGRGAGGEGRSAQVGESRGLQNPSPPPPLPPGDKGEKAWDIKRLFRLIVTSATYRQSAAASAEALRKDPGNRLLSRGPRFRMDAEMLRDHALAASGLLVRKIGGPSVRPYQPPGIWEAVAMVGSNTRFYKVDSGENLYRRSLYTFWKRSAPPALMETFNAPTREHCLVRRERTNTPLQALAVLNDVTFVEASRHLAQRALLEAPKTLVDRLDFISLHLIARPLEARERLICQKSLQDFQAYFQARPEAARKLIATGESKADPNLSPVELAAWTMLASQVMNLDEALNK